MMTVKLTQKKAAGQSDNGGSSRGMMRRVNALSLNPTAISARLTAQSIAIWQLVVKSVVTSTNDIVRDYDAKGEGHGVAVMAEEQTRGRGRRGRIWHSPAGANLYCSSGWHFSGPVEALSGLSLSVGAMVAEAVMEVCGADLQLKWPNDLYAGDQKVGGVLIEMLGARDNAQSAVIGIGLNVSMSADDGALIDRPWTDLATASGQNIDRNELASAVLNQLAEGLVQIDQQGCVPWLNLWRQRDYLKGRSIVIDGSPPVAGIAAGVSDSGALLIETESGRQEVSGGEASVLEMGALR